MNFSNKDNWEIVTVETEQINSAGKVPEGLKNLMFSASKFGWNLNVLGAGKTWEGWKTKIKTIHEYLSVSDKDWFLYVDGRDVLFVDTPDTFMSKVSRFLPEHKIVFCADTKCYPDKKLRKHYPYPKHKYRYLNAGCFFGCRKTFLKYTTALLGSIEIDNPAFDDQLWWTIQYLKQDDVFPLEIDRHCRIFQNLWDETGGRSANFDVIYAENCVFNEHTGTYPVIIHAPGPTTVLGQAVKVVRGEYC
jgi:hypothetical protein